MIISQLSHRILQSLITSSLIVTTPRVPYMVSFSIFYFQVLANPPQHSHLCSIYLMPMDLFTDQHFILLLYCCLIPYMLKYHLQNHIFYSFSSQYHPKAQAWKCYPNQTFLNYEVIGLSEFSLRQHISRLIAMLRVHMTYHVSN